MASAGLTWAARVRASLESAAAPGVTVVAALRPAVAGPPSPADRLHRHALESIFAFFDLCALAAAFRVSRGWQAAVGSMRRLELWTYFRPKQSALDRHFSVLGDPDNGERLDADDLRAVANRLANLRELHCRLKVPLPHQQLLFPAQLRLLNVRLLGIKFPDCVGPVNLNAAIAAIAQLPLLEELTVRLPAMDPQISFGPLTALPLLRHLRFDWARRQDELSDAQIDQLREMPRLHQVEMAMSKAQLRRLLRQPHDLQWQQIPLPYPLDDEFAALLPQLPSLTYINDYVWCERFDWLDGLPNLTGVNLGFHRRENVADRAAALVHGLQHCTKIESLALSGSTIPLELSGCTDLTAAHLAELLPRLPRLRELQLVDLSIDSLSFLSLPPLTSQLRRFELWHCNGLPRTELRHVHGLRGLTHLILRHSFAAPLDEESLSLLTPPSILLPLLEEFDS